MKKFLKWISLFLLLLVCGFAAVVAWRQNQTFDPPFPNVKASTDSTLIAKGKYLVYGPAHCADCHSDPSSWPALEKGAEVPLVGGRVFNIPIGTVRARNITPDPETGIGKMTDGEIARALRYGVSSRGRAFLDIMPFHDMSNADMEAIVSYLRSVPAVRQERPETEYNLFGKVINAFVIKPVGPENPNVADVERDTTVAFGKYLAYSVANCRGCHTNRDLKTGEFVGPDFAGGFHMDVDGEPGKFFLTPNLTPSSTGVITGWSLQKFISRFRSGKLMAGTHMPWAPFGKMSDNDLKAIYKFLQTVPAVEHQVPKGKQTEA